MNMTVDQITKEALSLPNDARARLADQLVESLDPAEDGPLQRVWAAEALRRLEEVRSGKVKTIPGAQGIEQVRRALKNGF
jgi:putative addiction module component (TIGR02574 family)